MISPPFFSSRSSNANRLVRELAPPAGKRLILCQRRRELKFELSLRPGGRRFPAERVLGGQRSRDGIRKPPAAGETSVDLAAPLAIGRRCPERIQNLGPCRRAPDLVHRRLLKVTEPDRKRIARIHVPIPVHVRERGCGMAPQKPDSLPRFLRKDVPEKFPEEVIVDDQAFPLQRYGKPRNTFRRRLELVDSRAGG